MGVFTCKSGKVTHDWYTCTHVIQCHVHVVTINLLHSVLECMICTCTSTCTCTIVQVMHACTCMQYIYKCTCTCVSDGKVRWFLTPLTPPVRCDDVKCDE